MAAVTLSRPAAKRSGCATCGPPALANCGWAGGPRASGAKSYTDDEKVPVCGAYLKRWKAEVGIFFEGTGPDSSDDQIRAIASKHPAFEVSPVK